MPDPIKSVTLSIKLSTSDPEGKSTDRVGKCWHIDFPSEHDLSTIGQDPAKMCEMMANIVLLGIAKGTTYGDSWRKEGEILSTFSNIMRKYDRVKKSIMDQVNGLKVNPMPRIDGTADFTVYGLLYLQLLEELYPDLFEKWKSSEVTGFIEEHLGPIEVSAV